MRFVVHVQHSIVTVEHYVFEIVINDIYYIRFVKQYFHISQLICALTWTYNMMLTPNWQCTLSHFDDGGACIIVITKLEHYKETIIKIHTEKWQTENIVLFWSMLTHC